MIYGIIGVFIPSVFGIKILDYLNKGLSLKNTIYYYLILFMFSNIFSNLIAENLLSIDDIFGSLCTDNLFLLQFDMISLLINIVLVFFTIVLQKNVNIEIKTKSRGKKNGKKASKKKSK